MSEDGKKSWVLKATVIAVIIWIIFIFLLYPFLRALGILQYLVYGLDDSLAKLLLLIIFVFFAGVCALFYAIFVQQRTVAILNEREITIKHIGKIYRLPYNEIKSAHTFAIYPEFLAFIDSMFKLDNIAIEAPRNFYIYAVKNAGVIVDEINKRVAEAKRPKGPTIEDLMREIKELKEEVAELKAEREREERGVPERIGRRRLEIEPMEEEM